MGIFICGKGTLLHQELIDTDEGDSVTGWNVWDTFEFTSHHNAASLDVLNEEIVFGSWDEVWSLDSDLHS